MTDSGPVHAQQRCRLTVHGPCIEAGKNPAGKGYFLVTGPQDFLAASPWAFTISWIDFYR